MTKLHFDLKAVQELAAHSLRSPRHRITFGMRCRIYGDDVFDAQPDEEERAPANLHLVKDRGIYLMSPGIPHLPDPANPKSSKVAYAKGYGPQADYDTLRAAVGGDDFADDIDIAWVGAASESGMTEFVVEFSETSLALCLPDRRGGGA